MSYVHANQLFHRLNCAISRAFSKSHAEATPDDGTASPRVDYGSTSRKGTALLTVTVDEADISRVRRAIYSCGPHSVEFVKLTRVPRDNRVRLRIALKAEAVSEAMSKIMGSVNEAEFGPITVRPNHGRIRSIQQVVHGWSGVISQPRQGRMTRRILG